MPLSAPPQVSERIKRLTPRILRRHSCAVLKGLLGPSTNALKGFQIER